MCRRLAAYSVSSFCAGAAPLCQISAWRVARTDAALVERPRPLPNPPPQAGEGVALFLLVQHLRDLRLEHARDAQAEMLGVHEAFSVVADRPLDEIIEKGR